MARSIKLFQRIQKMYRITGLHPTSHSNPNPILIYKKFLVLMSMVIVLMSSIAFILFEAHSTAEFATGFTSSIMVFSILAFFLITMLETKHIIRLIRKLENFIEMRNHNLNSKIMYTEFTEQFERFCKRVRFFLVDATVGFGTVFSLSMCYVNYYMLDLKDDSFSLAIPLALPFNWHTPFGYLIAQLLSAAPLVLLLSFLFATLCLYAGCCWLFKTIAEDITNDLKLLNFDSASHRDHKEMQNRFGQIIQHHTDVKQLIGKFNGIYEYMTFCYFLWVLLAECCYTLALLSQSDNASAAELVGTIIPIGYTFGTIFAYCESGERVTHQFNQFNEKFYQCKWYAFSLEVQRIYLIALVGVQQSVIIEGFANTVCTRDAFKKTVNGGFSYLMMLRRIDG